MGLPCLISITMYDFFYIYLLKERKKLLQSLKKFNLGSIRPTGCDVYWVYWEGNNSCQGSFSSKRRGRSKQEYIYLANILMFNVYYYFNLQLCIVQQNFFFLIWTTLAHPASTVLSVRRTPHKWFSSLLYGTRLPLG